MVLVRKCKDCLFYESWLRKSKKGSCLLFDSVSSKKRKIGYGEVKINDTCNYFLSVGERVELTQEEIANILNRFPEAFHEKLTKDDIVDLELIIERAEGFEQSRPK